ncbi:monocarboxylate transporter 3-like [Photinus pyralis]|uniref:monocarboxylate transporter 3-like n=1 Tax=Photinus pyralis TaxID=7054 RepID=UPI001266EC16|nr:monocarboxylate transporter 3-like [Photinus pyralis]
MKRELTAPDGGWGYVIVAAIAITNGVSALPVVTFGIVYGEFLKSVGDEIANSALASGICFATQWISGLAANLLLRRISYRTTGVLGALLTFTGTFGISFVTSFEQFVFCFSIMLPMGCGLTLAAMLTAFNLYFDKKRTVAYNLGSAVTIPITVLFPSLGSFLVQRFGFRGANVIHAAIMLHCLPAMLCLHPIEWHVDKQKVAPEAGKFLLGDVERKRKFWEGLGLGLFTDPTYVNIVLGISLCLSSDFFFMTTLPSLLANFKVTIEDTTILMTAFFTADIVGRLCLFGVTACTEVKNRLLLMIGAILIACARTGFILNHPFWPMVACTTVMGLLRCSLKATYPLIFAELYSTKFAGAFSLFMVSCGVVSISTGCLIGVLKNATQSNEMVGHFLTAMQLFCPLSWVIEIFVKKIKC